MKAKRLSVTRTWLCDWGKERRVFLSTVWKSDICSEVKDDDGRTRVETYSTEYKGGDRVSPGRILYVVTVKPHGVVFGNVRHVNEPLTSQDSCSGEPVRCHNSASTGREREAAQRKCTINWMESYMMQGPVSHSIIRVVKTAQCETGAVNPRRTKC